MSNNWSKQDYDNYLRKHQKPVGHKNQGVGQAAKLECGSSNEPLAKAQVKERHTRKVQIRYCSVQARSYDPDNLCSKFHTDSLRYLGIIKNDSNDDVEITNTQRKTQKGEEPHTIIEITYP